MYVLKTHFYKQIYEVDRNETSCRDIEDHKRSLICLANLNSMNICSVWTHVYTYKSMLHKYNKWKRIKGQPIFNNVLHTSFSVKPILNVVFFGKIVQLR